MRKKKNLDFFTTSKIQRMFLTPKRLLMRKSGSFQGVTDSWDPVFTIFFGMYSYQEARSKFAFLFTTLTKICSHNQC